MPTLLQYERSFIRASGDLPMSESQSRPSRRGFMLGAAVAGAATAAVVTLPKTQTPDEPVAESLPPAPERGGGYRLTEHVKRYYKTTLV
jgi:hypothetical protein